MNLRPCEPSKLELQLFSLHDSMSWWLDGVDWVRPQLLLGVGAAWASGAVVTVEVSEDGISFEPLSTSVTFSDTTKNAPKDRFRVTGFKVIRLRVSTAGGSSETAIPLMVGTVDPS